MEKRKQEDNQRPLTGQIPASSIDLKTAYMVLIQAYARAQKEEKGKKKQMPDGK